MNIENGKISTMDKVDAWLSLEGDVSSLRWDVYSSLQREAPFLPHADTLFVARHGSCCKILMNSKSFLNGYDRDSPRIRNAAESLDPVRREKYYEVINHQLRWLTSSDGSKHAALRNLTARVFSLRAIESMRECVQLEVNNRLDELANRDEFDIVSEFAYQLPLTIISEMLDIDGPTGEVIHAAWQCMIKMIGTPPEHVDLVIDDVYDGMLNLETHLKILFDQRRGQKTTDLLAKLLGAADEEGGTISERDIMGVVAQMVIAGHQTTQDTIGNGLFELLSHPEQWRSICENGALVTNAVEEILRYHTPGQMAFRTASEDVEVDGFPISAGSHITCLLGAANRDNDIFENPDSFDIYRENARQHLAFGMGVHHCLGSSLARIEAATFFATLATRFPHTELMDTDPSWIPNNFLHGLSGLRIRLR
jgi:cytochrome P450